jgi:hypothetical protein
MRRFVSFIRFFGAGEVSVAATTNSGTNSIPGHAIDHGRGNSALARAAKRHPSRPSPWVAAPRGKVEGLCEDGGRVVPRSGFRDRACRPRRRILSEPPDGRLEASASPLSAVQRLWGSAKADCRHAHRRLSLGNSRRQSANQSGELRPRPVAGLSRAARSMVPLLPTALSLPADVLVQMEHVVGPQPVLGLDRRSPVTA